MSDMYFLKLYKPILFITSQVPQANLPYTYINVIVKSVYVFCGLCRWNYFSFQMLITINNWNTAVTIKKKNKHTHTKCWKICLRLNHVNQILNRILSQIHCSAWWFPLNLRLNTFKNCRPADTLTELQYPTNVASTQWGAPGCNVPSAAGNTSTWHIVPIGQPCLCKGTIKTPDICHQSCRHVVAERC